MGVILTESSLSSDKFMTCVLAPGTQSFLINEVGKTWFIQLFTCSTIFDTRLLFISLVFAVSRAWSASVVFITAIVAWITGSICPIQCTAQQTCLSRSRLMLTATSRFFFSVARRPESSLKAEHLLQDRIFILLILTKSNHICNRTFIGSNFWWVVPLLPTPVPTIIPKTR